MGLYRDIYGWETGGNYGLTDTGVGITWEKNRALARSGQYYGRTINTTGTSEFVRTHSPAL